MKRRRYNARMHMAYALCDNLQSAPSPKKNQTTYKRSLYGHFIHIILTTQFRIAKDNTSILDILVFLYLHISSSMAGWSIAEPLIGIMH